jgi:hypothetical protein
MTKASQNFPGPCDYAKIVKWRKPMKINNSTKVSKRFTTVMNLPKDLLDRPCGPAYYNVNASDSLVLKKMPGFAKISSPRDSFIGDVESHALESPGPTKWETT